MSELTDGTTKEQISNFQGFNKVGTSDSKIKPFSFIIFDYLYCRRRNSFKVTLLLGVNSSYFTKPTALEYQMDPEGTQRYSVQQRQSRKIYAWPKNINLFWHDPKIPSTRNQNLFLPDDVRNLCINSNSSVLLRLLIVSLG